MLKKLMAVGLLMAYTILSPAIFRDQGEAAAGSAKAGAASPYVLPPDDRRETARLNDCCVGLENSYHCAQAVEKVQLPKYRQWAAREPGRLKLTLKSGEMVILQDSEGEAGVHYSFRDYLQGLGYFLIHAQLWEGVAYVMVNDRTGTRYFLHDLPILAPNRQRLATLSMDLLAQYNPNAIQVWRISPADMTLEWSVELSDWGPAQGRWADNDTLNLVANSPLDVLRTKFRRTPMILRKTPDGWKLSEK